MKSKDFKKYFNSGLEIIKLNPKAMNKVAKDKDATLWGVIFVVIAGVASAIGMLTLSGIVGMSIGNLIWSFIFVAVLWVISKLFGGKASFVEHYRVQTIGLVVCWITVIPIIGPMISWLCWLWYTVMSVVIVKNVHKLKTWQAVVVVLLPIVVTMILLIVFVATIIGLLVAWGLSSPGALEQLQQLSAMG